MIRLVVWTVVGLLIGLVVHLGTLLALPQIAKRTAFQRIEAFAPVGNFRTFPPPLPGDDLLPLPDPAFRQAVCRFDLAKGPVHVRAPLTDAFFSVSFYTTQGLNFYALTDRAAPEGVIELTIYTALQLAEVRASEGPDTPEALRVEAPENQGIIMLRALVANATLAAAVEKTIGQASCSSEPSTAAEPSRLSAKDGNLVQAMAK
jgi:uncharacterized membrane protein